MRRLTIGLAGDVVGEHREVIRDDRVVLLVRSVSPWTSAAAVAGGEKAPSRVLEVISRIQEVSSNSGIDAIGLGQCPFSPSFQILQIHLAVLLNPGRQRRDIVANFVRFPERVRVLEEAIDARLLETLLSLALRALGFSSALPVFFLDLCRAFNAPLVVSDRAFSMLVLGRERQLYCDLGHTRFQFAVLVVGPGLASFLRSQSGENLEAKLVGG